MIRPRIKQVFDGNSNKQYLISSTDVRILSKEECLERNKELIDGFDLVAQTRSTMIFWLQNKCFIYNPGTELASEHYTQYKYSFLKREYPNIQFGRPDETVRNTLYILEARMYHVNKISNR